MKDYVSSFDPRIVGLTGSQAAIDQVAHEFRVYSKKVPTATAPTAWTIRASSI